MKCSVERLPSNRRNTGDLPRWRRKHSIIESAIFFRLLELTHPLMQNLRYGDSGPIVEQIQTALNFAGPTRFPRLPLDGQFGALTLARVVEFQSFNDLTVDVVL